MRDLPSHWIVTLCGMAQSIETLFDQMETRKAAMLATLAALPSEVASRRPFAGGWSAVDLANHLMLVEVYALQQFQEKRQARIRRTLLDRLRFAVVRQVLRSRLRVKVPVQAVDPEPEAPTVAAIAERWRQTRTELHALVAGLAPDERDYCFFHHPYAGHFTCADGFAFVLLHWDHHEPQWAALIDA